MVDQSDASALLGNRYRLEHILGRGGMAIVYKAYDVTLERPVALKVLRQDYSDNPEFQARFHQEAKAAANLTHPNIVTIHDFGLDRGKLYIVMEYVPGKDLKHLIRENGIFEVEEAINIITQACAGIGYAHRAGIVHCDLKPLNMLVTPDKRLKVADFGIARALESIRVDEKTDLVWGSPQYFSPEQAAGLAPLPASDVYSLGVILYEMLTGQLPFQSSQPEELARMHREDLPPLPSKFNPLIPHELERIVLKVLTKAPSARYRSADQFGRILSNFALNTDAIPVQSSTTPEKAPSINLEHTQAPVITNLKEMQPTSVISNQPVSTVDWATWGLGLLAFLLAGGLIPFWMYVILKLNSIR